MGDAQKMWAWASTPGVVSASPETKAKDHEKEQKWCPVEEHKIPFTNNSGTHKRWRVGSSLSPPCSTSCSSKGQSRTGCPFQCRSTLPCMSCTARQGERKSMERAKQKKKWNPFAKLRPDILHILGQKLGKGTIPRQTGCAQQPTEPKRCA